MSLVIVVSVLVATQLAVVVVLLLICAHLDLESIAVNIDELNDTLVLLREDTLNTLRHRLS